MPTLQDLVTAYGNLANPCVSGPLWLDCGNGKPVITIGEPDGAAKGKKSCGCPNVPPVPASSLWTIQNILAMIAAVGAAAAVALGGLNHQTATDNGQKLQQVQQVQQQQDEKTADVKTALDKTHADTNAKLATIESKVEKAGKK